jgi:hypothetical protein
VTSDTNKRHNARYPVQLPVSVLIGDTTHPGLSENISFGGMFMELSDELPFGTMLELVGGRVRLQIRIDGHTEPFALDVTVRWTDTFTGVGVQFGALDARTTEALNLLLEELERTKGSLTPDSQ